MPSTVAASNPARRPAKLRPAAYSSSTPPSPNSAGVSRAANSPGPNSVRANPTVQYTSGGFSKYGTSFSCGITQSPRASISRGISA